MNIKAMAVAATLGAALLAGPAMAAEPVTLNATQMDQVVAGVLEVGFVYVPKAFTFGRTFNIPTGNLQYLSPVYNFGDVLLFGFAIYPAAD